MKSQKRFLKTDNVKPCAFETERKDTSKEIKQKMEAMISTLTVLCVNFICEQRLKNHFLHLPLQFQSDRVEFANTLLFTMRHKYSQQISAQGCLSTKIFARQESCLEMYRSAFGHLDCLIFRVESRSILLKLFVFNISLISPEQFFFSLNSCSIISLVFVDCFAILGLEEKGTDGLLVTFRAPDSYSCVMEVLWLKMCRFLFPQSTFSLIFDLQHHTSTNRFQM